MGVVGILGQLAVLGSVLAYSRDSEREADEIAFEGILRAGYDPREAARIWKALLKEKETVKESKPFIFFATHPPTEERLERLQALAAGASDLDGRRVGRESHLAAIGPHRAQFLRDELRLGEFAGTEVLLGRLLAAGAPAGEIHFFQGEVYRLRGEEGDAPGPSRLTAALWKPARPRLRPIEGSVSSSCGPVTAMAPVPPSPAISRLSPTPSTRR